MKHFAFLSLLLVSAIALNGCSDSASFNEKMNTAMRSAAQNNWNEVSKMAAEIADDHPKSTAPQLLTVLAYEKQGEMDKALDLARKCANAAPEDFTALYTFGRLSAMSELRYSEAFAILEKAIAVKPGDRNTLILLCNLGTRLKHNSTYKYLFELYKDNEMKNSGELCYMLGVHFAENNDPAKAVGFLRYVVRNIGMQKPEFCIYAARCLDHHKISLQDAAVFYKFYISQYQRKPSSESHAKAMFDEAKARIAILEKR